MRRETIVSACAAVACLAGAPGGAVEIEDLDLHLGEAAGRLEDLGSADPAGPGHVPLHAGRATAGLRPRARPQLLRGRE